MPETMYTTEQQIETMRAELRNARQPGKKGGRGGTGSARLALFKKIVGQTAFWLAVVFLFYALSLVLLARDRGEIPQVLGYQLYVVESGSMSPTLEVGAVIIARQPKDAAALQVNDIVTFRRTDGAIVTHRIIEVITDQAGRVSYRTKGDNPINSPDAELLAPERVIAKFVAKVPFT